MSSRQEPVAAPSVDDAVEPMLRRLAVAPPLQPFDDRTLAFLTALSRTLSADATLRARGEVQALAYWLRPTELRHLVDRTRATEGDDAVLVPRGTVFHVPPANVDTLFVYSWALSMLVGNRNIVRLSQRLGGVGARVATLIEEVLAQPANVDIRANTLFVRYGHDDERTRLFSAHCDVRVLWGGDAAVRMLRAVPLPPHAVELVFPDRYSAAVLSAAAVAALTDDARDALADRFANDAFWFDQMACSSPRLVAWIGSDDAMQQVAPDFWHRVAAATVRRHVVTDAATSLAKLTAVARAAADEPVASVTRVSPAVTVVRLTTLVGLRRMAPGGGLFHEVALPSVNALAPHLERRDQTLTAFGIPRPELLAAARVFNGRGVDRIVPVGQALSFHHVWDGYDLLQQFTRRVTVAAHGW